MKSKNEKRKAALQRRADELNGTYTREWAGPDNRYVKPTGPARQRKITEIVRLCEMLDEKPIDWLPKEGAPS